MHSAKEIWKSIISNSRKKIDDPTVFDGLIIKTREISIQDTTLIIEVESDFIRQKLSEQYMAVFTAEFSDILKNQNVKIRFLTAEKGAFEDNFELLDADMFSKKQKSNIIEKKENTLKNDEKTSGSAIERKHEVTDKSDFSSKNINNDNSQTPQNQQQSFFQISTLSSKYTFDTFIIGKSNQFAHGVSLNVARFPGTQYNPLFLYGGVGLGKTHLMQAIGHHILKSNKSANVIYVTCESFLNEMVNSMQNNRQMQFREKYRSADVLLVDDVQFLSGKEATQEEFFHTFNQLHQSRKQIVLTSDRPPHEIPRLEERLVSRFQIGMIADIQPPDLELRMAILQNARDTAGKQVPNEMISYIAQKIEGNIRKLEGAFIKVVAFAEMNKRDINESLIDEALFDVSQSVQKKITIDIVLKAVGENYRISLQDFKSKNRSANVAFPRQIAMYLCKYLVDASTTKIGAEFGGRDHSTVIHGIGKIEEMMDKDIAFRNEIEGLIQKIKKM